MTPSTNRPLLEIAGLSKWFGAMHALRDIDLAVCAGERIVLCGPSGSGKSTMVCCVNALERFQQGQADSKGTRSTPIATASSWSGAPSAWSSSR
jgi:ABC-type polar amino acid transport system ATPase subunit